MKRTWADRRKDVLLSILRRIVGIWMFFDCRVQFFFHDGFNPKRLEPYVLLGNHTFMFDVLHAQIKLKRSPYSIASRILFVRQPTKFLLSKIANAIPKSKGAADLKAVKDIFRAVKKGYPIIIFPEGDTTFYGETNHIEESTYKLIKKLKIDVVTINVRGGYLSKPRWATGKRKNRRAEFHYNITIKKEDVQNMSYEDIKETIKTALYNNDYEYQRKAMIKHPGKELAEGFDNVAYVCPNCDAINSIVPNGNEIHCTACGTSGLINEYGFIEGFKFDNLVEWDEYQRGFSDKLKESTIVSKAVLFYSDFESGYNELVGDVQLEYSNGSFTFTGDLEEVIPVIEITNPLVALRRDFNFTYNNKNYFVKLEKNSASFLRVLQEKY